MDGILLVDKPAGWTSHDVVAKVRLVLKAQAGQKVKVGHTGTLDPMATGLLILVIGNYTKHAGAFSKLDKVYEAEITLGLTSTTGDSEGNIQPLNSVRDVIPRQKIDEALRSFVGKISQTPHVYSAIKVGGKKSYEMARKGAEVKLEPREVTIYQITDVKYDYPILGFKARASSGTYIRSLAEDIGKALGSGAYLSHLRRIQVGDYTLSHAISIDRNTNYDIIIHGIQTPPKV